MSFDIEQKDEVVEDDDNDVIRILNDFPDLKDEHIYQKYLNSGPKFQTGLNKKSKRSEGSDGVYFGLHDSETGLRNGKGVLVRTDKSIFEAVFVKGRVMGQGRLITMDMIYDGNWIGEEMTLGQIITENSQYDGEVQNRKPHGYGIETDIDGNVYEGQFDQGVKSGKGTFRFASDDQVMVRVYVGDVLNDKFHGKGRIELVNGKTYDGSWVDGVMHGTGTYTWPDGREYSGKFKKGKRHGRGIFKWPDGKVFEGDWDKGKQSGSGTLTKPNGSKISGIWANGDLVTVLFKTKDTGRSVDVEEIKGGTTAALEEVMRSKKRSSSAIELAESDDEAKGRVVRLETAPSKASIAKRNAHLLKRNTSLRKGISEDERKAALAAVTEVFSKAGKNFKEEALKLFTVLHDYEYETLEKLDSFVVDDEPEEPWWKVDGFSELEEMDDGWYKGELERPGVRRGRGAFLTETYIYQGTWLNNKRHGIGRLLTASGDLYEGYYKKGLRTGFGDLKTLHGLHYIGDWAKDQFHGRGILKTPLGTYEGQISNGAFEGKGELRFADNTVYKGSFSKGLMHGYGVYKRDEWCYNAKWNEGSATKVGVTLHQSLMPVKPVPDLTISECVEEYFYQEIPEFDKLYPQLREYRKRMNKMIEKLVKSLEFQVPLDELDDAILQEALDQLEDEDFYKMDKDIGEEVGNLEV